MDGLTSPDDAALSGEAPVAARYLSLVAAGDVDDDPAQRDAAARFDRIAAAFAARPRNGLFDRLRRRRRPDAVTGLYLHGDVGRGKTMLMDLFHEVAPVTAKRRVHYSAFMGDVHDRVHRIREDERTGKRKKGDPIDPVAEAIAGETRLLCLDEFAVTDIADAMILSRLFAGLFARGLTLVATSNVEPDDLYKDGLNRGLFLPFIDLLKRHVEVVRFGEGQDYRLSKLEGRPIYVTPADEAARVRLDDVWRDLTMGEPGQSSTIRFKGRDIAIPLGARGVARFGFADLCEQPLGSGDFLTIARNFHTVIVDDIPVIAPEKRDVARRFILLIDTLYDLRVKFVASAEAEPSGLYAAPPGLDVAFRRTVSRLTEMRSHSYLAASHGGVPEGDDAPAATPLAPQ